MCSSALLTIQGMVVIVYVNDWRFDETGMLMTCLVCIVISPCRSHVVVLLLCIGAMKCTIWTKVRWERRNWDSSARDKDNT
jgi:uncharacterized membrane protein